MFRWWLKKHEQRSIALPDLSPAMIECMRTTIAVSSRQIEQCFGSGITKLPQISPFHDLIVCGYAYGFLNGMCLVTQADLAWAKGDRELANLGFMACMAGVASGLIAAERGIKAHEIILRQHAANETIPEQWRKVDAGGGADGMAIARGEPLRIGGSLLFLLTKNVTSEEMDSVR